MILSQRNLTTSLATLVIACVCSSSLAQVQVSLTDQAGTAAPVELNFNDMQYSANVPQQHSVLTEPFAEPGGPGLADVQYLDGVQEDSSWQQQQWQENWQGAQFEDQRPYVLILPGILGEQVWDRSLQKGISGSGFPGEVEIYDWTHGPLAFGLNIGGNKSKIQYLRQRIMEFKYSNPMRPLYLIGHSGGCRMVVNILETLPRDVQVERSLLLSPCMESNYNLSGALAACRSGMIAFRAPTDIPISVPLTTLHGITQGRMSVSASALGFKIPKNASDYEVDEYSRAFSQLDYNPEMLSSGHLGGHFGWTTPKFASRYIVPLLR